MKIEHINPPALQPAQGLSHIVKVTGGSTLYFSGQGAYDAEGNIVGGGDHYEQAKQALANVATALEGAGATLANVVKVTYYVVGLNDKVLRSFVRALYEIPELSTDNPPVATMVGVEALGFSEMLIEIEVTAVVD